MIDFHSHILPNIDDGAKDALISVEMLKRAKADGIDTVVSTSHIYITDEDSIDKFLENRAKSRKLLEDAAKKSKADIPKIIYGSEIRVRRGIGDFEKIPELKIGDTDYILLEMPYLDWKEAHFETVYDISSKGLTPVMAHIERFYEHRKLFDNLKSLGVIFQVNADSFLEKSSRKELLELFKNGYVHLLGSDMHNLDSRKNNLKTAYKMIEEKFGKEYSNYLIENGRKFFSGEKITNQKLPELSFMQKLKL